MIKTDLFLKDIERPVGSITTEKEIQGSRINDFGVSELSIFNAEKEFPINWLLKAKFKIKGSPREQTVWDFKDYERKETEIVLRGVILKPDGLCIACGGTGKFQAKRHKATAKCPTCKGSGFVTEVWIEETEGNSSGAKSDTMVGQPDQSDGTSSS